MAKADSDLAVDVLQGQEAADEYRRTVADAERS